MKSRTPPKAMRSIKFEIVPPKIKPMQTFCVLELKNFFENKRYIKIMLANIEIIKNIRFEFSNIPNATPVLSVLWNHKKLPNIETGALPKNINFVSWSTATATITKTEPIIIITI